MSRPQVKYTYQIGVDAQTVSKSSALTYQWSQLQDEVIMLSVSLCGGCTVNNASGYWIDGQTHSARFTGDVNAEYCLSLELTTETSKESIVYADMRDGIKRIAAEHPELSIQWVHCSKLYLTGMHFDVTE